MGNNVSKKLYIKTFGCQMNDYDSSRMADLLAKTHQLEVTDTPEEADVLLVSDSRFAVDEDLRAGLQQAGQALGLRVQGINVSDWNSHAMEAMCDTVYRISRLSPA